VESAQVKLPRELCLPQQLDLQTQLLQICATRHCTGVLESMQTQQQVHTHLRLWDQSARITEDVQRFLATQIRDADGSYFTTTDGFITAASGLRRSRLNFNHGVTSITTCDIPVGYWC
jgi:hypothetical protein